MADDASSSSSSEDEVIVFLAKQQKQKQEQTLQRQKNSSKAKKHLQANVHWRAISTDELRLHPLYLALPLPESVTITSPSDFCQIRQGTWQWDALHSGRLTTSKAAACLGFYESKAASLLGIPNGLTGHERAERAWHELVTQSPLSERDWAQLSAPPPTSVKGRAVPIPTTKNNPLQVWSPSPSSSSSNSSAPHPFKHNAPRYSLPNNKSAPVASRRTYSTSSSARLAWGSAQESTAILQVINYIDATNAADGRVFGRVAEVGLMPIEAVLTPASIPQAPTPTARPQPSPALSLSELSATLPLPPPKSISVSSNLEASLASMIASGTLPLLGASPDGIVRYTSSAESASDLSSTSFEYCEILEVKCSSPFVTGPRETLAVVLRPPQPLGSWHIPQLQLEILCAGPKCTGALLMSLTAQGGIIYRVKRDDSYIANMLQWLSEFKRKYMTRSTSGAAPRAPERDFFYSELAYKAFLQRTVSIAAAAEIVKRIPEEDIQRSSRLDELLV